MKFKFCGNHECPEWILAEIVALCKISSIRIGMIVKNIIEKIKGQHYDLAKVEKYCLDSGLSAIETKSALAVVEFIIRGAIKFQMDEADLLKEIEQLGLPGENVKSFVKAISKEREPLNAAIKHSVFRLSRPVGLEYQISYVVATDKLKAVKTSSGIIDGTISLKLTYEDSIDKCTKDTTFALSKSQLGNLLAELKRCEEIINKVEF